MLHTHTFVCEQALLNATTNFRYRMIPYIYSGFYRVEVSWRLLKPCKISTRSNRSLFWYLAVLDRLTPHVWLWLRQTEGYTMQRALVFDFASDATARTSPDQFMFGDALMVAPIVTNTTSRDVRELSESEWHSLYTCMHVLCCHS